MTLDELILKVQLLAEYIGPNLFLQATIIAAAFIFIGKIADWIISGIIGRFARQSSNNFDNQIVDLVHKPIFVSFVLLGLSLATSRLHLSDTPTFMTLGIIKTLQGNHACPFSYHHAVRLFIKRANIVPICECRCFGE